MSQSDMEPPTPWTFTRNYRLVGPTAPSVWCSICMSYHHPRHEEERSARECIELKACKHQFHWDCLRDWIKKCLEDGRSGTCPVCQIELVQGYDYRHELGDVFLYLAASNLVAHPSGRTFLLTRSAAQDNASPPTQENMNLTNQLVQDNTSSVALPAHNTMTLRQILDAKFLNTMAFKQLFELLGSTYLRDSETECSICLEPEDQTPAIPEHAVRLRACTHVFHLHCIRTWLNSQTQGGHGGTCPMCRHELPRKELSDVLLHPARLHEIAMSIPLRNNSASHIINSLSAQVTRLERQNERERRQLQRTCGHHRNLQGEQRMRESDSRLKRLRRDLKAATERVQASRNSSSEGELVNIRPT